MDLLVNGLYFTVKESNFQFDHIVHVHPNYFQGVKYFSYSIYTGNKHSLSIRYTMILVI